MSTQEIRNPIMYVRQPTRRKMIEGDLDVPSCPVNMVQGQQMEISPYIGSQVGTDVQHEGSMPQIIDVEAYYDDVIVSSPRAFEVAKAKNTARRIRRRTVIIDLESEGQSTMVSPYNLPKRRRVPSNQSMSSDLFMIVAGSSRHVNENVWSMAMPLPPPPPPPPPPMEPTCPVCIGPFVEAMSTKCGHIFCKKCIRASIAVRGQCPTCRGKISMKNTIRVYLPTAN